jgi:hypothetical protein
MGMKSRYRSWERRRKTGSEVQAREVSPSWQSMMMTSWPLPPSSFVATAVSPRGALLCSAACVLCTCYNSVLFYFES